MGIGYSSSRDRGRAPEAARATLDDALVIVQQQWNGWRTATTRLRDLEQVQWKQPAGAPRPLIHAHVRCDRIVSGQLPHDCSSSTHPHEVMICVLKSHTAVDVFDALVRRADRFRTTLGMERERR